MAESLLLEEPESEWLGTTRTARRRSSAQPDVLRDAVIKTWSTLWLTTVGAGRDLGETHRSQGSRHDRRLLLRGACLPANLNVVRPPCGVERVERGKGSRLHPRPRILDRNQDFWPSRVQGLRESKLWPKDRRTISSKKEKSGFYITVNFFNQILTLIRFGWIDADDWDPQESARRVKWPV